MHQARKTGTQPLTSVNDDPLDVQIPPNRIGGGHEKNGSYFPRCGTSL